MSLWSGKCENCNNPAVASLAITYRYCNTCSIVCSYCLLQKHRHTFFDLKCLYDTTVFDPYKRPSGEYHMLNEVA